MGNIKHYEGDLIGNTLKIGIVVGRFNTFITEKLLDGALDALKRHGVEEGSIEVAWVPGAIEIPVIAKHLAFSKRYDAICCLGAVIRGGTPHFDHVANQVARGVAEVSLKSETPVIFGVLTTDTIEQAIERAGTKAGNKGFETAMSAIEMAHLIKKISTL